MNINREHLAPCPFCAGAAKRITLEDADNFGGDVITCSQCGCCTRVVFGEKEGLVESWNHRAQAAPEAEPVAWRWLYNGNPYGPYAFHCPLPDADVVARVLADEHPRTVQPLYTAPQHDAGWREHSKQYAKGEKCPETIETLQAAWDRDQELMMDQKAEISRLKEKLNRAEQRNKPHDAELVEKDHE